ncbi:MAG: site-specific integrase [Nitrososphaeraceae archaeon]
MTSLVEEGSTRDSQTDSNNVIEEKRKQEEQCTITDHKSVNAFLLSMLRNSQKSKNVYKYGLAHFQKFLTQNYPHHNIESILRALLSNEVNVYVMLDGFISYIIDPKLDLTSKSIQTYVASIRSYLAYHDVDVIPSKFKRKVKMPKMYREDEEPLDASDIRKILLACNNRRLKTYMLVLASGGFRANEALAMRLKDVDFTLKPTKVHVRPEFAKTKVARDVYISDEATHYLKEWIKWKHREQEQGQPEDQEDLIFTVYKDTTRRPATIYVKVLTEFEKLLASVGLDERKEGKQKRRKITFHSFRRFVKTVISDQVSQDYSEWFLGHNKSPYYTKKEPDKREIYATKCMKYLTFLDYTTLETTGKNIEAKLSEKEKEIQLLRQRDTMNTDAIGSLSDQLANVIQEIEILKKQK